MHKASRLAGTDRVGYRLRRDRGGKRKITSRQCLSDTPGMNAAATVLLAFLRPTFLRLFVPRDTLDTLVPAVRTMGISPFLKYLVASVLVHHGMLLTLEFFSFVHIGALLLRIVTSTLLTVACIMAVEGIRKK